VIRRRSATYYYADWIVNYLVDVVSKNRCFLLNVSPKADGTICDEEQDRLRKVGNWLDTNGEAICGTRAWKTYGEGPTRFPVGGHKTRSFQKKFTPADIRFTAKGNTLYAISLEWPGKELVVASVGKQTADGYGGISQIRMMGAEGTLTYAWKDDKLVVTMPETQVGDYAFVTQIVFKNKIVRQ